MLNNCPDAEKMSSIATLGTREVSVFHSIYPNWKIGHFGVLKSFRVEKHLIGCIHWDHIPMQLPILPCSKKVALKKKAKDQEIRLIFKANNIPEEQLF